MMISEMPTTPCRSTSSATENALCSGVFSGMICRSLRIKKEYFKNVNITNLVEISHSNNSNDNRDNSYGEDKNNDDNDIDDSNIVVEDENNRSFVSSNKLRSDKMLFSCVMQKVD